MGTVQPEGNLYYSSGDFSVKTSQETYLAEATAWHRLSIQGDKSENHPGQWEVRIFFDDALIGSTLFTLKAVENMARLPDGIAQKSYPKDWEIIIGIEDYASLPRVEYAKKDALIIKDYFVKVLMVVPEENAIFLVDSDATKARARRVFEAIIYRIRRQETFQSSDKAHISSYEPVGMAFLAGKEIYGKCAVENVKSILDSHLFC